MQRQIKADWNALSITGCRRLSRLPDARRSGGAPAGRKNGNYRHDGRIGEVLQAARYIYELARMMRRDK